MLYEMTIEDELLDGVFAISFVDNPAIQEDYVLLSKDSKFRVDIKLDKITNSKKKLVSGPILIPDKIIPRQNFDIVFRKETIRKISENFLMNGNKDNVTLQHQLPVNKIYMVESWIVEDPKKDKSNHLGYELPAGTWFATYKVVDDNLWSEFLETGKLKGFSLEGSFSQKEIEMAEEFNVDEEIKSIILKLSYTAADLETYYKWDLGPKPDEACPSCIEHSKQVLKLNDWIKRAIPAVKTGVQLGSTGLTTSFPHSPYGTFCQDACKCKLIKVQGPDFIKRIKRPTSRSRG